MTTEDLNDAWCELEAAIDDWVADHAELIRHPDTFAERAADVIFEDVLGLTKDDVDGWEVPDGD